MRITVELPEHLVRRARRACGACTTTETLLLGLEALVREERLSRLWDLRRRVAPGICLKTSRAERCVCNLQPRPTARVEQTPGKK